MLVGILFSAVIGSVSFWGSLVAFGKLQELITGRPLVFPGQNLVNAVLAPRWSRSSSLTAVTENGSGSCCC